MRPAAAGGRAPGPGAPPADPHADAGGAWMRGRAAVVTGGGLSGPEGGVGYAISVLLARHGASVAVVDRDPSAAEVTVAEIRRDGGRAEAVVADVCREEDCRRAASAAAEAFGGVDALVNNAASGDRSALFDVTPAGWDELISRNLTSAWLMTRSALPVMREAGERAVVNVSSVAVARHGPGTVYGVAKAGVENLTRGAASLLGPRGIRVNCVQLGEIWSAMAARELPAGARDRRRQGVALRTEGTCWDAAYAALFLASDRARWISGHILTVDAGGPLRSAPGSAEAAAGAGGGPAEAAPR